MIVRKSRGAETRVEGLFSLLPFFSFFDVVFDLRYYTFCDVFPNMHVDLSGDSELPSGILATVEAPAPCPGRSERFCCFWPTVQQPAALPGNRPHPQISWFWAEKLSHIKSGREVN